jgi:plasmid stabilization system protein ParE
VRIIWLLRARRELRAQREYIARDQPLTAARIARAVVVAVEQLANYPYYGRTALWDKRRRLRELPVPHTPLVVVYGVDEPNGAIVILRVVHGAQRRGLE